MSYITSLGIASPPNKIVQPATADFMIRAMDLHGDEARRLRALYQMTGIESRYSVLSDYNKTEGFSFFNEAQDLEPFPSTKKRMAVFREHACPLSVNAIRQCFGAHPALQPAQITHLIVVSCTGMYAPGLDIDIVNSAGLPSTVERTAITFMGCYASFNALKIANQIVMSNPDAKVLVVSVELCTIHFQKEKTEDNYLANALFADGAAAVIIESQPVNDINLKMTGFHCDLAPEGNDDMAWTIGDLGFEMKLSSYVPDVIRKGIGKLTQSLLQKLNISLGDIAFFAIHPGGKKILEVIEKELAITRQQNKHAYNVLRNFGNMSSPTVLFVLYELMRDLRPADHEKKVLSFAFGPGLTLESMVLQIHC